MAQPPHHPGEGGGGLGADNAVIHYFKHFKKCHFLLPRFITGMILNSSFTCTIQGLNILDVLSYSKQVAFLLLLLFF